MRVILLGGPGAGKGTQSQLHQGKVQHSQISPAICCVPMSSRAVSLGVAAKKIMDQGGLVSDDIIMGMVKERIKESDCKNGFLFDGFPRTIPQAEALTAAGVRIDAVVEIDVPDQEIITRGWPACSSGFRQNLSRYFQIHPKWRIRMTLRANL